ncbi:hypothetical protein PGQ11_009721 [Apiospora arundinis]|uniref:Uncharacterized protein n=1 Tax=Apiospora arundinis TaxID=335852 RepID=A0ABR2I8M6_9PEZI
MTDLLVCTKATCDSELYGYCSRTLHSARPSLYEINIFAKEPDRPCTPRGNLYNSMPDNDVAGPGLITAYFLQAGLGLWFHVTSNLLSYWAELFISLLGLVHTASQCIINRRGKRPSSGEKQNPTTQSNLASLLQRVRMSRPAIAVFSSLVEFQEAQVFFVIALQIAALVVYGRHDWAPADFIDAHSAAFFAAVTPLIAFMTQSSLQRAGRRWWYTFILTLLVYILAVDVDHTMLAESGMKPLDQCGGSENVLPSCLSPRDDNTVGGRYAMRLGRVVVGCSHFIMALLAMDQLGHYSLPNWVPRPNWWAATDNNVSKLVSNHVVSRLLRLTWLAIDVVVFVLLSSYLGNIDYDIYWLFLERPDWDYGQIVAVLPWKPVFFKCVYLTLYESADESD